MSPTTANGSHCHIASILNSVRPITHKLKPRTQANFQWFCIRYYMLAWLGCVTKPAVNPLWSMRSEITMHDGIFSRSQASIATLQTCKKACILLAGNYSFGTQRTSFSFTVPYDQKFRQRSLTTCANIYSTLLIEVLSWYWFSRGVGFKFRFQ